MKKKIVALAINQPVLVEDFEGDIYKGYLVKDENRKNHFILLPFDYRSNDVRGFFSSHIKIILLLKNNYLLKDSNKK